MRNFAAIDFETANEQRTSVCSVGVVIVRDGEITDSFYNYAPYRRTTTNSSQQWSHHHALAEAEACERIAIEVFRERV